MLMPRMISMPNHESMPDFGFSTTDFIFLRSVAWIRKFTDALLSDVNERMDEQEARLDAITQLLLCVQNDNENSHPSD